MVTFRCVNKDNNKTTYKYFPEADERKKSGLITPYLSQAVLAYLLLFLP